MRRLKGETAGEPTRAAKSLLPESQDHPTREGIPNARLPSLSHDNDVGTTSDDVGGAK